jgi:phage terminase large subunit GpA-like protein
MSINTSNDSANRILTSQAEKIEWLKATARKAWAPPPRISVPDWADQYRQLAKEAGSTAGNWETSTVEVARGPMLAVTEPGVHVVTAMVSTQLLKTALLENVFGYFAHLDPCPILLLQPKEDAAEQFSKERISPMIRVTPVLRDLIGTVKTRNAAETLLYKAFPGGFLALAGAGSPDNLARRPVRVILADEVDKYPVTREGDPIALAEERTATFGVNWLSVRACSPTITDESRIEKSYLESDRRRASAACPHCGHRMFLDFFRHVDWEKTHDANGNVVEHLTKTARISCECCGVVWSEGDRLKALRTTRHHQTRPFECCGDRHVPLDAYDRAWRENAGGALEKVWDWWQSDRYAVYRAKCPECGKWGVDNTHAGFQAGKLFSPWQKDKPSDIAKKYVEAKGDPDLEQAWWNTQMGLPHRTNTGKELPLEILAARGEKWPAAVPDGVAVLAAGVDVQDYRLEIEVVGWGRNEESWSVDYEVIDGEFDDPHTQAQLDAYLAKVWRRADGRKFNVVGTCIDSGGHHTQAVYEYCKKRLGRHVWAIKGESARNGQRNPVWPTKRPSARNKAAFRPIILGVNAAKDTIRNRLYLEPPAVGVPKAGYMHFPADRDINYYAQLTSERLVTKVVSGQKYRVWEQPNGKANEASDCRVYAYAALCGLMHFGLKLNKRADQAAQPYVPAEGEDVEPIAAVTVGTKPTVAPAAAVAPAKKSRASRLARI